MHRDLKPENVIVTEDGIVKILDFGLAKLVRSPRKRGASSRWRDRDHGNGAGISSEPIGYMSPEQASAKPLDFRSDQFSFGSILYEMATGRRAFTEVRSGRHSVGDPARGAGADRGDQPLSRAPALDRRALPGQGSGDRYESTKDLTRELVKVQSRLAEAGASKPTATPIDARVAVAKSKEIPLEPARPARRSKKARLGIVAAVVVLVAAAGWLWHRASRERWALQTATPEIARLVDSEEFAKAATLARQARAVLPKDPTLEKLWQEATWEISIGSEPTGAEVSVRRYRAGEDAWESLGKTPLQKVRVPIDDYVTRIGKPGFATAYALEIDDWVVRLNPEKSVPPDMVGVQGGEIDLGIPGLYQAPRVPLGDYVIDQHEVTNEEYKRFVDAGGYQKREFWKQPFLDDARTILRGTTPSHVCATRRAAPAPRPGRWAAYPKGLEKHPVAGVSWYEAAAYAEFAGKSLPTIYHWSRAAQMYAPR